MIEHFAYGWTTPAIAYAVAFLGSFIGLQAAVRARSSPGQVRAGWLAVAAFALGATGIWATHFIAMLGFSVQSTILRYDVLLTVLSGVLAMAVVAAGLAWSTMRRPGRIAALGGGAVIGLGAVAVHSTGMAALRMQAVMDHDWRYTAAAAGIALVSAAVALLLALRLRGRGAAVAASLVLAAAITTMHYTAMFGVEVTVLPTTPFDDPVVGATMMGFFLPVFVGLGLLLMIVSLILMLSPAEDAGRPPGRGAFGPPQNTGRPRRH